MIKSMSFFSILSHNLERSLGHHRWVRNNPFPFRPVFSRPSWAGKVHSCSLFNIVLPPLLLSASFFVLSLCPVELSLLSQKTLKPSQTILVSVSWSGSGVRLVLQWPPGSVCKHPHRSHGPCMKCSIVSGSISSQRPAFFSLTLQSRSMIHRHTEIW